MTEKWEVVLYGEIGRVNYKTEKEAKSAAEYHARLHDADYKINKIEVEDEEEV